MTVDSCLALYGNSVFMVGIKAELSRRLVFELITIEAGCPNIVPVIRARKSCALIFDQTTSQPDFSMSLLCERPGLLLIGVDPSSDENVGAFQPSGASAECSGSDQGH